MGKKAKFTIWSGARGASHSKGSANSLEEIRDFAKEMECDTVEIRSNTKADGELSNFRVCFVDSEREVSERIEKSIEGIQQSDLDNNPIIPVFYVDEETLGLYRAPTPDDFEDHVTRKGEQATQFANSADREQKEEQIKAMKERLVKNLNSTSSRPDFKGASAPQYANLHQKFSWGCAGNPMEQFGFVGKGRIRVWFKSSPLYNFLPLTGIQHGDASGFLELDNTTELGQLSQYDAPTAIVKLHGKKELYSLCVIRSREDHENSISNAKKDAETKEREYEELIEDRAQRFDIVICERGRLLHAPQGVTTAHLPIPSHRKPSADFIKYDPGKFLPVHRQRYDAMRRSQANMDA